MSRKNIRTCKLKTPFENNGESSWTEYPRPQLKRASYISLCGKWSLSVLKNNTEEALGEITVPFPPESRISGIERELLPDEKYIYRKSFVLPDDFNKGHILINFGAVDCFAEIRINETPIGGHNGGYIPFCFDITSALKTGENIVEVIVADTLDTDFPYGKQCRKRGGMWYTPISGIWQAVWLESVPENYINFLKLTPSLDSITIETEGGIAEKNVTIHTENGDITESFSGNKACIKIPSPVLWSPENPYLYSLTLECGEDRIESYFGLRTIETGKVNNTPCILLNGKPYYFHGLLDQGYYSDGIYTPASPEGYLWDIKEMKKLGFNMLRKHIKIEPDLFYYYCDKYGMIVFQDFVNSGKYNFLIDTALPTIGLKKGITHTATKRRKSIFEDTAEKTISLLYNHPCVCYYTIFNEGWGQYEADRIYEELKKLDPTRIYDATSGWFTEKKSDVKSEHIYFRKIKLKTDSEKPLVLSEFGGYSCKIENHCFNLDENYGYKNFDSPKSLSAGLSELYLSEIVPAVEQGLCADVLTQVSDVEDETNGLCTYDRQVIKVEERTMKIIAKALNKAFEKKFTV